MKQFALSEQAVDAPGQLYNLKQDPGETQNLYHQHPEIVEKLKRQLDSLIKEGRSAPIHP